MTTIPTNEHLKHQLELLRGGILSSGLLEGLKQQLLNASEGIDSIPGVVALMGQAADAMGGENGALLRVSRVGILHDAQMWSELEDAIRGAKVSLPMISAESMRERLREMLDLIQTIQEYKIGIRKRSLREFRAQADKNRGYFSHIAHTYLGLHALEEGDREQALESLALSMSVEWDKTLQMKGLSRLLVDELEKLGVSDSRITAFFESLKTRCESA